MTPNSSNMSGATTFAISASSSNRCTVLTTLKAMVSEFQPGRQRKLGVLLDHLVPGSKETRIAQTVQDPNVLITGHPFVDVWAGIRPKVLGLDAWPDIPYDPEVTWKEGLCARTRCALRGFLAAPA